MTNKKIPNSKDSFPMIDATDHAILMHRDAHFGGLFSIMLPYYRDDGKGVQVEFKISRIEQLAVLEEQLKENLAAAVLSAHEAHRVADAIESYRKLRDIYEINNPSTVLPRLIADLILAEDEAEEEIKALVAQKNKAVTPLIDILKQEEFYDPLFPGYGQAPYLAAKTLGLIGDKRAIIAIFEAIGKSDFFVDEHLCDTLKQIGTAACTFLLQVVKSRPLNEDNIKAAIALLNFKNEPGVADSCFELVQKLDVHENEFLSSYLILICAGLQEKEERAEFIKWSLQPNLPRHLLADVQAVKGEWNDYSQVTDQFEQ